MRACGGRLSVSRNWFYQNEAASILSYNIELWSTCSHITSFVLRMFECAAHAVECSPAQLHLALLRRREFYEKYRHDERMVLTDIVRYPVVLGNAFCCGWRIAREGYCSGLPWR
jgi:hypothetical protein